MVAIADCIAKALIVDVDGNTPEEIIRALIDVLDKEGKLVDRNAFVDAVFAREEAVATAIGYGIAIPHAKLSEYDDFFIVIGRVIKGVDWDSLDGEPVTTVFLVGGPDDKPACYLNLLSDIMLTVKDRQIREQMLRASPEELTAFMAKQRG